MFKKIVQPDNPATLVDRLNGIYPSAIGVHTPSPINTEAAREIVKLRERLETLAKVHCGD